MNKAINIYQVFTRLFRNDNDANKAFGTLAENGCSKFEHFTPLVLQALKEFGITHIWFTGILRHASCTSYEQIGIPANNPLIVKGIAGSPYAVTDYYDVDPDLATEPGNRMKEFEDLILRCHSEELKIIIDFVPNHVARQYKSKNLPLGTVDLGEQDTPEHAFSASNNFYYIPVEPFRVPDGIHFPYTNGAGMYIENPAKATGNDAFTATPGIYDWYETVKLNYGIDYQNNHQSHLDPVPDTWKKMADIMRFWAQKGVDGLRCDMAEMIPVPFWNATLPKLKKEFNELIFIAEVYNPQEYNNFLQAGFDYLYDKVGLYDIMRGLTEGRGSTGSITDLWQKYEGYSHKMLRFLENHDEQRIASSQFAGDPWKAMPSMILAATLNTGPFMIYFGQELGEKASDSEGYSGSDGRTTIFDYWQLKEYQKWVNKGKVNTELLNQEQKDLREFYSKLLKLRLYSKAIHSGGFYDLMWVNHHNPGSDKIYAYLRYFREEVLLIVLNFNPTQSQVVQLKVPPDAIKITGLPESAIWNITDLMNTDEQSRYLSAVLSENGITLNLNASSGMVLKIN